MKIVFVLLFSFLLISCGGNEEPDEELGHKVDAPNEKGEYIFTDKMALEYTEKCYSNYKDGAKLECKDSKKSQYCSSKNYYDGLDDELQKTSVSSNVFRIFMFMIIQVTDHYYEFDTESEGEMKACRFGQQEFSYPYEKCLVDSEEPYVDKDLLESIAEKCKTFAQVPKNIP